jgi:ceramide glucosyltransferase
MIWLAGFAVVLACIGTGLGLAGWWEVRRFCVAPRPQPGMLPALTVLKPLNGDEPLLEAALESFFTQDYPQYQMVFGVHREADTALPVLRRLQHRFPDRDIAVVVDATRHGRNGKVTNLVNMMPAARHDVLVMADADLHAAPDYLRQVAAALAQPGIGLVTTLYTARAATPGLVGQLGASAINHGFLPGALMARALGRRDCFGATIALRRETLEAVGGMASIADYLAEDAAFGRKVPALGLGVRLAATVPATTVPESGPAGLAELLLHELRWARTIRALVPVAYLLSGLQYELAWAGLAVLLSGGAAWAVALFLAAWAASVLVARGIDRALLAGPHPIAVAGTPASPWLLPLRDVLSLGVLVVAFMGRTVRWRDRVLRAERVIDA